MECYDFGSEGSGEILAAVGGAGVADEDAVDERGGTAQAALEDRGAVLHDH